MIGTDWPTPNQLQDHDARRHGGRYVIVPRTTPDSEERLRLEVTEADWRKIGRGASWKDAEVDVTDLLTGRVVRIKGMACSYPSCFCDAFVVATRADS